MRARSSMTDVPTCTISVILLYVHLCFRHCRIGWQVEHVDNLILFHECKGLVPRASRFHAAQLLSTTAVNCLLIPPCCSAKMSAPLPLYESRGSSLIISQWTTVSIASLLVILRIYARAFRKIAGADDWTIVIALVHLFTKQLYIYLEGKTVTPLTPFHFHLPRPSPSPRASSQSFKWTTASADTSNTSNRPRSEPSSS